MIGDLSRERPRRPPQVNYGCGGWVAHHNADLWRQTAPVGDFGHGDPVWAIWPMGGAWLCQHLWEHFAFGGDRDFLRDRAYPIMKGAAEFCLDWLIEDGQGHLVTAPSTSPENKFRTPDGQAAGVSMASTMDMADHLGSVQQLHRGGRAAGDRRRLPQPSSESRAPGSTR